GNEEARRSGLASHRPGGRHISLVPKRGLEPLRLSSLPPQGSASTNSATWAETSRRLRRAAHCTRYSAGVAASCAFSSCAGAGTSLAAGAAAGTSEAAAGGGSSPGATTGAAGTSSWPITPRSCCTTGRALWVAYQAMNRLMPKNTTASHLVLLERKLD